MRFYLLCDATNEALDVFCERELALSTLAEILNDEPEWRNELRIEELEFGWNEISQLSPN